MQQLGCQVLPSGLGRELPGPPSKPCCYEACSSPGQWDCQGKKAGQREGCRAQGSGNLTEKRQGGKAGQCRAGAGPARLGRGRAGLSVLGLLLPASSQCVAGASPRRLAAAVAFASVPATAAGTAAAIASHGARPRAAGQSASEKTRNSGIHARVTHASSERGSTAPGPGTGRSGSSGPEPWDPGRQSERRVTRLPPLGARPQRGRQVTPQLPLARPSARLPVGPGAHLNVF